MPKVNFMTWQIKGASSRTSWTSQTLSFWWDFWVWIFSLQEGCISPSGGASTCGKASGLAKGWSLGNYHLQHMMLPPLNSCYNPDPTHFHLSYPRRIFEEMHPSLAWVFYLSRHSCLIQDKWIVHWTSAPVSCNQLWSLLNKVKALEAYLCRESNVWMVSMLMWGILVLVSCFAQILL